MKYLFRQFPDPGSGCGWFPGTILCFNDVVYSYPGWIVPFRKNGSIDRKRVLEAMQIFLISIATLVVFAALLIGILVLVGGPTKGPKIPEYTGPRKALLVIDVQEDFTGRTAKAPFPYKNSKELITSINRFIEKASHQNYIVVYIRQEFDGFMGKMVSRIFSGGTAIRGNPGTGIDSRISIVNNNTFPKPKGDAFSNPELGKFLAEHKVNELYLTGLDAQFCVFQTARGALNRGYRVNVVTDCIALRAEKKWDALMKKYERNGIILKKAVEAAGFHKPTDGSVFQ
jgi:nicotinamidase/pyrazinamidase